MNKEKFVLYAVLSLCVGIILVLLVIIVRLVQTRRRVKREARMDITDPVPTSSPPPPDDFTSALLNGNHSHPQGDTSGEEAAEIISYSHNRGPPPFRSDTGTRSFNNYYGWLERESVIMWSYASVVQGWWNNKGVSEGGITCRVKIRRLSMCELVSICDDNFALEAADLVHISPIPGLVLPQ